MQPSAVRRSAIALTVEWCPRPLQFEQQNQSDLSLSRPILKAWLLAFPTNLTDEVLKTMNQTASLPLSKIILLVDQRHWLGVGEKITSNGFSA
jgi:hypothetical protein